MNLVNQKEVVTRQWSFECYSWQHCRKWIFVDFTKYLWTHCKNPQNNHEKMPNVKSRVILAGYKGKMHMGVNFKQFFGQLALNTLYYNTNSPFLLPFLSDVWFIKFALILSFSLEIFNLSSAFKVPFSSIFLIVFSSLAILTNKSYNKFELEHDGPKTIFTYFKSFGHFVITYNTTKNLSFVSIMITT